VSIQEWKSELFCLYRRCREHPTWPKNFEEAMQWQDDDAREYLKELYELDKRGALNGK